MSLQENWSLEIPPDTAQVARAILDEHNPYRLIGDHANDLLNLDDFRGLYDRLGRGAICPIILSLVIVFQFLENIPDRVAAQWVVSRIDWKYALHMPLHWGGFHYSDLSNFRQRVLEHAAERIVFERVLEWVRSLGLLKKHSKQRTDSTHVLGRVERLGRLELVGETLRAALRAMRKAAPAWYQQVIPAAFHETYAERQSAWRLSQDEVQTHMRSTGSDGYWLLEHIDRSAPEQVRALPEVETLRQVWEQQFDRRGGQTIVHKPPIKGKDVLASPHETEARWAKKRGQEWIGYKLHVTETVEEELAVQMITDIGTSAANDDDSEALDEIQQRLIARDLKPAEQNVDRGYVSGLNLVRSAQRGIELVGPVAGDQSNKPAGYRQADFALDFAAQRATCPAGKISCYWSERAGPEALGDPQRRKIDVGFARADCAICAHREQCQPGRQGRSLGISAFYDELSTRRAEQQTEAFRERMKRRAGIEGTLFGLVWSHGVRRARYRGQAKLYLQALFTGAAAHLKRVARALQLQQKEQSQSQVAVGVGC